MDSNNESNFNTLTANKKISKCNPTPRLKIRKIATSSKVNDKKSCVSQTCSNNESPTCIIKNSDNMSDNTMSV